MFIPVWMSNLKYRCKQKLSVAFCVAKFVTLNEQIPKSEEKHHNFIMPSHKIFFFFSFLTHWK